METKDIVQKNMYTIDEEVGEKMITDANVEDEHKDEEKDNLGSTNDDDNIHALLEISSFATSHYVTGMQLVVVCNYIGHVCNYKFGIA
jgi:hypothetical protein